MFALELANHPEQDYVTQLLWGIWEGFKIGYTGPQQTRESPNLKSAINHPDVVSGYLQKECNLGRIGGPFNHPPFPNTQCHPIGVVPKKDQGKFRTILHLSYPQVSQSMILFRKTNTHYTISPLIMPSKPSKDLGKGHSSAS